MTEAVSIVKFPFYVFRVFIMTVNNKNEQNN